jgi:hypothetical protein
MHGKLSGMRQSVQSALDKLKNIKGGQMIVNSARTPVITALNDEHKKIGNVHKCSHGLKN